MTTVTDPRPPFRADHVGSLLRPPALKALRLEREAGRASSRSAPRRRGRRCACGSSGGGVRGWGRDVLGTGAGKGREGAEGVDVDYALWAACLQ